jgi:hypothetical protein
VGCLSHGFATVSWAESYAAGFQGAVKTCSTVAQRAGACWQGRVHCRVEGIFHPLFTSGPYPIMMLCRV